MVSAKGPENTQDLDINLSQLIKTHITDILLLFSKGVNMMQ